ncbi:polyprenyl synthetase family protein [Rothia halotolerans]|uniref:polyprenyl synthetase family protein n=1 Tax=Rothia halotolerans TaxID=405770 RepID=UPI001EE052A1|nr:polyprenyl synthetase family protein [Rothia halotolerans]
MNSPAPRAIADAALSEQEQRYVESVERTLLDHTTRQRLMLTEVSLDALPLIDAIEDLCRGGKRLRALFAYWGWRCAGGDPEAPAIVRAGAAIELFQAAALIHDDIIDHSDTRRGRPSVHRRFQSVHEAEGWRHDARGFGEMAGIIAGDLCLSFSEAVFASIGTEQSASGRARRIFDTMRTEVMAGQYLDGLSEAIGGEDPTTALERASTVIRFKSAKYSCEHPLAIGAALAGAAEPLLRQLRGFGLPLGEAFQLRDDVLGVFGEPELTGKPAGDDLREGKRTVLTALTEQRGGPEEAALLDEALGDPALDDAGIERVREAIRATGALTEVERIIDTTERQVRAALQRIETDAESRRALEVMASRALRRAS